MLKKNLPHLLAIIAFLLISIALFPDVLSGDIANQPDMIRYAGAEGNVQDVARETGEPVLWNNTIFSGMPAFFCGTDYPNNLLSKVHNVFLTLSMPRPIGMFFVGFLGAYLLFLVLGMRSWLSFIGSIAITLMTYNFIIFEVGHITKLRTIAYFPLIAAGLIYAFKKDKALMGSAIFGLGLGISIWSNHIQMTYYLAICLGLLFVCFLVYKQKNGELKTTVKPIIFLAIFSLLAVGSNTSRLWASYEYMKHTMRGPAVLTDSTNNSKKGLTKDYVFNWSHGKAEIFTYMIPGFLGGSSSEPVSTESAFAKDMMARGAPESSVERAPLYWGSMPSIAGPTYFGAIIVFLFVLGLFVSKGYLKWWVVIVTILFTLLSFGKNLAWFNDIFYNYFPLYNKFRSVNSSLAVLQLTFPVLAILGLYETIKQKDNLKDLNKKLLISLGITGGICLFFALLGPAFLDFGADGDLRLKEYGYNIDTLLSDRASLLRSDSFRSFFFIALTGGLIWLKINDRLKIKENIFYGIIALLIFMDFAIVGKRYLNSSKFIDKDEYTAKIKTPRPVDNQILSDPDKGYRVFDASIDMFNSNEATRFHNTIGGYHPAKLRRYQDMIERHIGVGNMSVLNMLNTKYFIQKDQQGQATYRQNPGALGHCWFVDSIQVVQTANEEIDRLSNFNPRTKAIVHQEFNDYVSGMPLTDTAIGQITRTYYSLDELKYKSNCTNEKLAVFPEVWYASGRKGWQAYIDNKPVEHIRANYILRAIKIPAGQHEIRFEFRPYYYFTGETLSLVFSSLLILGFLVIVGLEFRKNKAKAETI